MYQVSIPKMLTAKERAKERAQLFDETSVMVRADRKFEKPVASWPGVAREGDVRNGERIDPVRLRDFLTNARALIAKSPSAVLTAECSGEDRLLAFFKKYDYDGETALFMLKAKLGLGVLEALQVRSLNGANSFPQYDIVVDDERTKRGKRGKDSQKKSVPDPKIPSAN